MDQQKLVMDDRHSSGGIESSSVLFERAVPVRIKSPSEDRLAELTIRILMGLSKHRRSTKVLQVQITNELDPFFLYSLEVNEEDFQSLKVEQCILVDFGTFPHKFIELLEHCIRADAVEAPRFLAILNVRTGDSTFSVVETNQFKHLSHLSLCFRQGNDSTIKSYLAGRLSEYKGSNVNLHDKLRRTLESLETSLQDVSKLKSDLADSKETHYRTTNELEARHARELSRQKEKAAQECLEMKERLERERLDMEARLLQKAALQEQRVTELDKQVRELTSVKHNLEIKVAELKTKLDLVDKDLLDRQQECDTLRKSHKKLDKELELSTKQLSDHIVRLTALEHEVQCKAEMISTMSRELESLTSNRAALESALKDAQGAAEKAAEKAAARLAESSKCNQTIEKLQTELKGSKAKLKLKAQVTAQQETLLQERQAAVEKQASAANEMKQEMAALKSEIEELRRKEAEVQKRSEEFQEELKSNQQMIQWLNQQLTDAQLGKYSKYTSASRGLPLSSLSCNSSGSPKAPLLPSNIHNLLHRPDSPASINSKSSRFPNHHQQHHHLHQSQGGFMSKVTFKPPIPALTSEAAAAGTGTDLSGVRNEEFSSSSNNNNSNRKVAGLEFTRSNLLPKPQFSFVSQPASSERMSSSSERLGNHEPVNGLTLDKTTGERGKGGLIKV